jgi:monovalent cation:H+ antiporter-2, CPA2 family
MEANPALVALAAVVAIAAACGLLAGRLRQPPVVGYIAAGVLLGPSVLGLLEDRASIRFAAELGVLALLFVAGMRLNFQAFRDIYRKAVAVVVVQIGASVVLLVLVAPLFDWSIELAVFLGFVISLSSTAIGLRMLEETGELETPIGRLAVGILIAQDLAIVPILIATNALLAADTPGIAHLLGIVAAILLVSMLVWHLSRHDELPLPFATFLRKHRDLAAVFALMCCFVAAAGSGALGLSTAFGAFLAGFYLGNTADRELLTRTAEPIEGALVMIFFLSIGLLLDPGFVWERLAPVLFLLAAVFLTNSLVNVVALRLAGVQWDHAVPAGFALGQIGEFSFVLAAIGLAYGLIDEAERDLVISVIALGFVVSPFWFGIAQWVRSKSTLHPESQSRFWND